MAKHLEELIALLPAAKVSGSSNKRIEAVAHDSRKITPNSLFFCIVGDKADGHDYIPQAVQQGAAAVVVEKDISIANDQLTVIKVPDTRQAMQQMVPYYYNFPGRVLRMIGVTGTNGKTTTTHLIRSILMQAGYRVGLIGTVQAMIDERVIPVKNTTPDVIELQALLSEMVDAGMDYAVMEVSSHALALDRIAGCEFDVGIFTNITQDHLDFHKNFANYTRTKALLFDLLSNPASTKPAKTAVINMDDSNAAVMLEHAQCRTLTYGIEKQADITAQDVNITAKGADFTIAGQFGTVPMRLKITGIFNVYNVLGAVGACIAENVKLSIIKTALERFNSVPGRFELVDEGQPFSVIVDYAHTPDGLENILKTAKQFAQKRIIVVFGCGGDRDRTKRPIMGKLAAEYGDIVIATSDNPRTEDPEQILKEIEKGIQTGLSEKKSYQVIADRKKAIDQALHIAKKNDIVIIAGKGHETYQVIGTQTIPFDDREVAREIIREMR